MWLMFFFIWSCGSLFWIQPSWFSWVSFGAMKNLLRNSSYWRDEFSDGNFPYWIGRLGINTQFTKRQIFQSNFPYWLDIYWNFNWCDQRGIFFFFDGLLLIIFYYCIMLMQSHMSSREQRSKPLGFISFSFKLMILSAQ